MLPLLAQDNPAKAHQEAKGSLPSDLAGAQVAVPFEGLDTLCVGAWWERDSSQIIELRVPRDDVLAFGLYTVQGHVLKLSAQLYPLYPK